MIKEGTRKDSTKSTYRHPRKWFVCDQCGWSSHHYSRRATVELIAAAHQCDTMAAKAVKP